jgi:hypothetical protein
MCTHCKPARSTSQDNEPRWDEPRCRLSTGNMRPRARPASTTNTFIFSTYAQVSMRALKGLAWQARLTRACHSGLPRARHSGLPRACHSGLPHARHSGLHKSIQCHVMLKSSRLCKHTSMHAVVLFRSHFRRSRAFNAGCGCVKRPCIDTIIQLHRFTKYATSLIS